MMLQWISLNIWIFTHIGIFLVDKFLLVKFLEQILWAFRILTDISKLSSVVVILIYTPPTINSKAASPVILPTQCNYQTFLIFASLRGKKWYWLWELLNIFSYVEEPFVYLFLWKSVNFFCTLVYYVSEL